MSSGSILVSSTSCYSSMRLSGRDTIRGPAFRSSRGERAPTRCPVHCHYSPTPIQPQEPPAISEGGKEAWRCTRRALTSAAAAVAALRAWPTPAHAETAPAPEAPPPPLPLSPSPSRSPLSLLEAAVHEFTLPGCGPHVIVMQRRAAPVVACHSHVNVGAFEEEEGETGLAHLLEHMAFKGTADIGTTDARAEAALLTALDEAFYELRELEARAEGPASAGGGAGDASGSALARARRRFTELQAAADTLVVPNAFGALLTSAGGVGLNAATSHDATVYYCSLPCNKLELWMAAEAQRFRAPVFRQLYSEKRVVAEERRARLEASPSGAFRAAFAEASLGNNYRRPVLGYAADVASFGRRELTAFFNKFYHPGNLTLTVVGDVDPEAVQKMAERYFGGWRAGEGAVTLPRGPAALAAEVLPRPPGFPEGAPPPAPFAVTSAAGPLALLSFYRPTMVGRRGTALEVAADVLAGGRTSRLTAGLVLSQRAVAAGAVAAAPGEKHAGSALVYGVPHPGDTCEGVAALLRQQLDAFLLEGPTQRELDRVKKAARVDLLAGLQSNSSLAGALAAYHASSGSWRGLVEELEVVGDLGRREVVEVAREVFDRSNCFTGYAYPLQA